MRPSSSSVRRPRNPRRRREVGGRARQPADEVGVVRRPPLDLDERPDDLEAADDVPEVERHGRADEMAAVGAAPGSRGTRAPTPTARGATRGFGPAPRRCRPRSRSGRVPSLTSAATSAKYAVDLGPARVGVGEGVVLVGGQRRLPPGGRSEREPRPRRRAPAVAVGGDELDQAHRRRVGLERDDPADVERRDAGPDQAHDHLRQVRGRPRRARRRVAAWAIDRRSANGVRLSRYIRSVAVTTPSGVPAESTTGRWWMPGVEHVDHRVDRQALGRERLGAGATISSPDRRGARAGPRRRASGAGRSR